jgi:hypothetical protein
MRYFPGTLITLQQAVRVADVLTDAAQISFKWKEGLYGSETTVTPTRLSVGLYSVSIIPTKGSNLYYRWDTDGVLDVAQEGILNIADSQFQT